MDPSIISVSHKPFRAIRNFTNTGWNGTLSSQIGDHGIVLREPEPTNPNWIWVSMGQGQNMVQGFVPFTDIEIGPRVVGDRLFIHDFPVVEISDVRTTVDSNPLH